MLENHYTSSPHVLFSWSRGNSSISNGKQLTTSIQCPSKPSRRKNCLAHPDRMRKKSVAVVGKVPEDQWIQQVQDGLQRLASCVSSLPSPNQTTLSTSTSTPPAVKLAKLSTIKIQPIQPTSSSQTILSSSKSADENLNTTTCLYPFSPKNSHKSNGESEKKEKSADNQHAITKKLSLKEKMKKNPLLRFKM